MKISRQEHQVLNSLRQSHILLSPKALSLLQFSLMVWNDQFVPALHEIYRMFTLREVLKHKLLMEQHPFLLIGYLHFCPWPCSLRQKCTFYSSQNQGCVFINLQSKGEILCICPFIYFGKSQPTLSRNYLLSLKTLEFALKFKATFNF